MADRFELTAPCHFGMEAVLKREIQDLGYPILKTEDGKVTFEADALGIARANIFLRTTERILLKAAEFQAVTFDELFERVRAVDWASLIPADGKVWVKKANSLKSKLFSPSDIQSIVKKAIVEKMKEQYRTSVIPETGNEYPLRISILKDNVVIGLDTSDIGGSHSDAVSLEGGPDPRRSVLRVRDLLHRGSDDGLPDGTRDEPQFYSREMDESDPEALLV